MKQRGKGAGRATRKNRINEEIDDHQEVRLIAAEGEQVGVVPISDALQAATEAELDLVEISPDAEPPVCRLMDYGKHIFEEKKKRAESRKKQKQTQVKEIKFRPGTEDGDYQVKLRSLTRFLEDGDKAKVTLRFRGREMAHQELGMKLLQRVQADLEQYGSVEQFPKMEGRQMIMVIGPKKKK
ncbi:MAG: translation initiation factor IF-3 [Pseudomonadales bacterium]|nr:translation initiation factor IF-3 [Pseudomonadales bacterium]